MTSTHKLRLNGTPRKFARYHGLRSPHVAEPRAILCVGRHSTGMVFARTFEELDAAFSAVEKRMASLDALTAESERLGLYEPNIRHEPRPTE